MKCQKCEKPATFHITEITDGDYVALHLCADCAEKYLKPNDVNSPESWIKNEAKIEETTESLAKVDQKSCEICGITFYDFRQVGRLGCPHDYVCFEEELEPLIMNIHGETEHRGKRPKSPKLNLDEQTQLIQLRRQMKDAVDDEDYERASQIRDAIRKLEKECQS